MVAPALEEIASERDDLRIVKLNTDDNQQTAVQYQVLSIPTMILFRNGQEVKRIQARCRKAASRPSWSPLSRSTFRWRPFSSERSLAHPSLRRAPRGARRRAP